LSLGKALIVYDSMFGNTEKVAMALAKGLEEGGVNVDCVRVEAVKFDELRGAARRGRGRNIQQIRRRVSKDDVVHSF
jgi:flavorubredoxin